MSQPCENSNSGGGIYVEACSGDGTAVVCTIGQRKDLKHIVKVTNLMLYSANIECKGEIQASRRKVKFSSSAPGDTESTWKASKQNLQDSETYTFDSVILLPALSGTDKVDATVTVRRARPKGPETVGVTIDVTA